MSDEKIAIAIDGPAAAGKSTVAKKVAKQLSYIYIDTGAMYRALTYKALIDKVNLHDEKQLHKLIKSISIDLRQGAYGQEVYIGDEQVTREIRTDQVTNHVSTVAMHASVREEMVKRQQFLAEKRGVVMDGRDIGTHVIPDAEVKIFLIASVEERAQRRHKENTEKGYESNLEQIKKDIQKRDQLDSEREVAPLIKAQDAIEIDTTSSTIDEVAQRILEIVDQRTKRR